VKYASLVIAGLMRHRSRSLLTFASALGAFFMKALTAPILRRYGFRQTLLVNTFLGALFIAVPAFFTASTPSRATSRAVSIMSALDSVGRLSMMCKHTSKERSRLRSTASTVAA